MGITDISTTVKKYQTNDWNMYKECLRTSSRSCSIDTNLMDKDVRGRQTKIWKGFYLWNLKRTRASSVMEMVMSITRV